MKINNKRKLTPVTFVLFDLVKQCVARKRYSPPTKFDELSVYIQEITKYLLPCTTCQAYCSYMYQHGIKNTLKGGAVVFGVSAIFLLAAPEVFLDLLGLEDNPELIWSMRMIGITLIALAGNMWQNSKLNNNPSGIKFVARVMFISALALGILTIFIPAELTVFSIIYAAIGLSFALLYLINLIRK